jgi:hypothetical protein
MFTGDLKQLSGTDSSDLASQLKGRGNVAPGDDSEAAFALLYTEALGLAREQYPATSASVGDEVGLLDTGDYGGPRAPSQLIPGKEDARGEETWQSLLFGYNYLIAPGSSARVRQFNDQNHEPESPQNSGDMRRGRSQNRTWQLEPVPDAGLTLPPALNPYAHLLSHPPRVRDAEGNLENSGPVLDKSQLANWMDAHALTRSSHHCAMYCRLGMEAAGLSTQDRPPSGDAADYGPFLLRHGAQVLAADSYTPQVGDTVVFDKTAQHPNGHIEMYDGQRWVSDFMQHSFSPYRDAASTPPFTIYRLT